MGYIEIEDALQILLATLPDISEENISKSDWSVLNYGWSQAIILEYGGLNPSGFTAGYTQRNTWVINIYILSQYRDDAQVHRDLNTLRQNVMDKVQEFPKFNSTLVFDANIVSGRVLPPNIDEDTGTNFFWEVLECHVDELSRIGISG